MYIAVSHQSSESRGLGIFVYSMSEDELILKHGLSWARFTQARDRGTTPDWILIYRPMKYVYSAKDLHGKICCFNTGPNLRTRDLKLVLHQCPYWSSLELLQFGETLNIPIPNAHNFLIQDMFLH